MHEDIYRRFGLPGLKRCAETRPMDPGAHFFLGLAALDEKKPEEAELAFARAMELDPNALTSPKEAALYRAKTLRTLGRREEAAIMFERAVVMSRFAPQHTDACLGGADLLIEMGRLEPAVKLLFAALGKNDGDGRVHQLLSRLSLTDVAMPRPKRHRPAITDDCIYFTGICNNTGACRMRAFASYDGGSDVVLIFADEDRAGPSASYNVEKSSRAYLEYYGRVGQPLRFIVVHMKEVESASLVDMGPKYDAVADFRGISFADVEKLTGFRLWWTVA